MKSPFRSLLFNLTLCAGISCLMGCDKREHKQQNLNKPLSYEQAVERFEKSEMIQAQARLHEENKKAVLDSLGIKKIVPIIYQTHQELTPETVNKINNGSWEPAYRGSKHYTRSISLEYNDVRDGIDWAEMRKVFRETDEFKEMQVGGKFRVAFNISADFERPDAAKWGDAPGEICTAEVIKTDQSLFFENIKFEKWPGIPSFTNEQLERELSKVRRLPARNDQMGAYVNMRMGIPSPQK